MALPDCTNFVMDRFIFLYLSDDIVSKRWFLTFWKSFHSRSYHCINIKKDPRCRKNQPQEAYWSSLLYQLMLTLSLSLSLFCSALLCWYKKYSGPLVGLYTIMLLLAGEYFVESHLLSPPPLRPPSLSPPSGPPPSLPPPRRIIVQYSIQREI